MRPSVRRNSLVVVVVVAVVVVVLCSSICCCSVARPGRLTDWARARPLWRRVDDRRADVWDAGARRGDVGFTVRPTPAAPPASASDVELMGSSSAYGRSRLSRHGVTSGGGGGSTPRRDWGSVSVDRPTTVRSWRQLKRRVRLLRRRTAAGEPGTLQLSCIKRPTTQL